MPSLRVLFGAMMPIALTACASINAANYTPSIDNIQTLHAAGPLETRIRTFDSKPGNENPYPVPLRAASMRSPVGNSFGAYLSNAMEQELLVSGAISPSAQVEVSGTLLKNDVDSSGFSRGEATISARFIVRRGDQVVYDSVKTASGQWKSSFMGAVAIGNAIEAYPHIVGRLLAQLYADPVFVKSIQ